VRSASKKKQINSAAVHSVVNWHEYMHTALAATDIITLSTTLCFSFGMKVK